MIRNKKGDDNIRKIYKCCICGKNTDPIKPIRYQREIYGAGKYKQYYPTRRFDICVDCNKIIMKYLILLRRKMHEQKNILTGDHRD